MGSRVVIFDLLYILTFDKKKKKRFQLKVIVIEESKDLDTIRVEEFGQK
jgi:hypothetical protein